MTNVQHKNEIDQLFQDISDLVCAHLGSTVNKNSVVYSLVDYNIHRGRISNDVANGLELNLVFKFEYLDDVEPIQIISYSATSNGVPLPRYQYIPDQPSVYNTESGDR